jgi:enamine deaminase RidA (YjgF/YER057c/UK114 family)
MHSTGSPDEENHPYSLVRVVDGIGWCAGVLPYGPDGEIVREPEAAIDAALRLLGERLEEAGASLDDVVKVTVFLSDIEWRPQLDAAWLRTWKAPRPARTALQVARLPRDAGIEIEAVVHRASDS